MNCLNFKTHWTFFIRAHYEKYFQLGILEYYTRDKNVREKHNPMMVITP